MTTDVLVTGGTGTLGRRLVRRLLDEGTPVRVLSRRPHPPGAGDRGPAWVVGDLLSGTGLATALDGVQTIVHCASGHTKGHDVRATKQLLDAARTTDARHLVFISIVGIDRVPLPYYRDKLETERAIAAEIHTVAKLVAIHLRATGGRRRPVLRVPVPGRIAKAYRAGGHLAPDRAVGRRTFEEFCSARRAE